MADEMGGQAMQAMVGRASVPEGTEERGTGARRHVETVSASTGGSATRRRGRAAAEPAGRDLRRDLRDFAAARPQGWGHDDWLAFLEWLKERGHNIVDRDAIGSLLERERLDLALAPVHGVGPQRRAALVDRYGTVWNLRNADEDEIAATARISREMAERVKAAVA